MWSAKRYSAYFANAIRECVGKKIALRPDRRPKMFTMKQHSTRMNASYGRLRAPRDFTKGEFHAASNGMQARSLRRALLRENISPRSGSIVCKSFRIATEGIRSS
jgi:hypothetical protein